MDQKRIESLLKNSKPGLPAYGQAFDRALESHARRELAKIRLRQSAKEKRGMMMLPWVFGAAAVLLVVLWSIYPQGNSNPFKHDGKNRAGHFAAPDIENCRYVGLVGEEGVVEYEDAGKPIQVRVKSGDILFGHKVLFVEAKQMDLQNAEGLRLRMPLKGRAEILKRSKDAVDESELAGASFIIQGRVCGADGNLLPGINVTAWGLEDKYLSYVPTDAKGEYIIGFTTEVCKLRVNDPKTGLCLLREGSWKSDSVVNFKPDLPSTITLNIEVNDLNAKLAPQPRGLYSNLGAAADKGDGKFQIITDSIVEQLTLLWGPETTIFKKGPWKTSGDIMIDIQKEPLVRLKALIIFPKTPEEAGEINVVIGGNYKAQFETENGDYLQHSAEESTSEEGEIILTAVTVTNKPVGKVKAFGFNACLEKSGPWKESAEIVLRADKDSEFVYEGKIVDETGKPMVGSEVYFETVMKNQGRVEAVLDEKGAFKFYSNHSLKALTIFRFGKVVRDKQIPALIFMKEGNWKAEEKINVDLSKEKLIHLKGLVVRKKDQALPNHALWFQVSQSEGSHFAMTDKTGRFEIYSNLPLTSIYVTDEGYNVKGPWDKSCNLTIDLSQNNKGTLYRGKVLDERGRPFDCSVGNSYYLSEIQILGPAGLELCSATLKDKGLFEFRTTEKPWALTFWHLTCFIRVEIDADPEKEITIDLRDEGYFSVQGTLKDSDGKPLEDADVFALYKDGASMKCWKTDSKGFFKARGSKPLTGLEFSIKGKTVRVAGEWIKNTDDLECVYKLN